MGACWQVSEGHQKNAVKRITKESQEQNLINNNSNNQQNQQQPLTDIIEESTKNIIEDQENKIIYKKKVKVALTKGEPAFKEAAQILRNMQPLEPLIFKNGL